MKLGLEVAAVSVCRVIVYEGKNRTTTLRTEYHLSVAQCQVDTHVIVLFILETNVDF